MTSKRQDEQLEASTRGYVAVIHLARVAIAAVSLAIAIDTRDVTPFPATVGIWLASAAVGWTLLLAVSWRRIEQRIARWPRLIWLDGVVMVTLSLADKPWDSLVAMPYCSFVLLVPFVRPRHLALFVVVTAGLVYVPKLVALAIDWQHTEVVPPASTIGWLTLYVGPLFCGTVAWALCLLFSGIRSGIRERENARLELFEAEARHAVVSARIALANGLHETLSQVVRAIPLRLDGPPPVGLVSEALRTRDQIIETALRTRPALQQLSAELRASDLPMQLPEGPPG